MRTGVYEDIFFNLLRSAIVENLVKNHGKMRVTVTCDVFLFLMISHIYPQAKSVYDNQFNGVFKYKRKLQLVCEERTNSRIRFHKLHEVYFELHNIEKDFLPHFKHFYNSENYRFCLKALNPGK